ncbi:NAD(P)H-dependent flavin oxidoreductase [Piscinibacter sakaiensis]|uniref:Propionate 3-nitronate monooxygenase n=1 Tax=Piscinibacter sakaiensis TaxID=1547922 RepID=A0A0K8NVR9_PISS1|nr:nitronate monooxygenase [Piscinibacter sakaiensis]GAP34486.1 enoyl-ACP reductase [FMN] [Piscinibacter sakaiensis]
MNALHALPSRLPIVQAPMAGAQASRLALAVCAAGGLGSLPCATLSPEALAAELSALRAQAAGPWNLNFFCHRPPPADAARDARWQARLAPWHARWGSTPGAGGAGRAPFSHALADRVEAGGGPGAMPSVVSFHFGLPAPDLLARVRGWGAAVWSTATTVEEARWLADQGVDAVIAQGLEAGGHRGHFLAPGRGQWLEEVGADPCDPQVLAAQAGSLALLPQVVAAVDVPVIAAGGFATPEGVAVARLLGASAVQVGTAYLLCPEADTAPLHRAALQAAREAPGGAVTALTNLYTGRPARGLLTGFMREAGPIDAAAPAFPGATAALAPLRAAAEAAGSTDFTPLWSGQNLQGCSGRPAGELTRQLAAGW